MDGLSILVILPCLLLSTELSGRVAVVRRIPVLSRPGRGTSSLRVSVSVGIFWDGVCNLQARQIQSCM